MKTQYLATTTKTIMRSGAGTSNKKTGTLKKGTLVTATAQKKVGSATWYKVSLANGTTGWIAGKTTKAMSDTQKETYKTNVKTVKQKKAAKVLASKYATLLNAQYTDSAYLKCTTRLFGAPHQFLASTDYRLNKDVTLGMEYLRSIMTDAPIVYMTPGKPNYLPALSKKEKNSLSTLFGNVAALDIGSMNRSVVNAIIGDDGKDVRYFDFTEDYPEYMRYVNLLCRMCAIYMGLGNKTAPVNGKTLRYYNWKNYKWRNDFTRKPNSSSSMFEKAATIAKNATTELKEALYGKYSYIPFYMVPSTTFRETMSNNTRDSELKGKFESAEDYAKELQFLSGQSKAGDFVSSALGTATSGLSSAFGGNSNSILSRLISSSNQVIQGANIRFPEMWADSTYDKSFDFTVEFSSPYGNKEAVYLNCIVPLCHLIAFVLPKNTSPNSYASPFLVKAFAPGIFSTDLGIIESLDIEKGGDGCWTVDGLPTKFTCTVRLKELYTSLSMNKTTEYKNYFKNTSLMTFLAVTCGVDITKPQVLLKLETLIGATLGKFTDIPSNITSNIEQALREMGLEFFKF